MGALLELRDLVTAVRGEDGEHDVLTGVSLSVRAGEIVGIVGESGCGKSMTALSVMGLLGKNGYVRAGNITFDGRDVLAMTEKELDAVRGSELCMIYQDALTALSPVFTVGNQLVETMRAHLPISRAEAKRRAIELLDRMGLPDPAATAKKYPHMLSGGQRQRVMIAMALCCGPKLLIADEPTTALDVTIQAQIMQTLRTEQQRSGMSMLLISHDIGLIAGMCDRVLVMYAGQVIEQAAAATLFSAPAHPYTQMLMRSVPQTQGARRELSAIPGQVPARYDELSGCRFAPRCPHACQACGRMQNMLAVDENGHAARCHLAVREEAIV